MYSCCQVHLAWVLLRAPSSASLSLCVHVRACVLAPAPGQNGIVLCELPVGSFSKFVCTFSLLQLQQLQNSGMYFNVHTSAYLAGTPLCLEHVHVLAPL
jgi:hypothetical protein